MFGLWYRGAKLIKNTNSERKKKKKKFITDDQLIKFCSEWKISTEILFFFENIFS